MRWLRLVSLRLQIVFGAVVITLLVSLGYGLRSHRAVDALAKEQFEQRSVTTAAALAARATGPILTDDLFGLYELLNDTLWTNREVRYILVLDDHGAVYAHTFGGGLPRGLVEANAVAADERWHVRRLRTEEGTIVDVAAPILDGTAGSVRLGMSERSIAEAVNRFTLDLLALTAAGLLPVLALTYVLGRALTQPLLELVDAARAIGRGDLGQTPPVEGRDEVAQLSAAFNAMTRDLARSQEELESSNRALQERNEELAALLAVATAIAHADSVSSLAGAALDKAMDILGVQVGWVLLHEHASGAGPALRASRGLPAELSERMAAGPPQRCLPGGPRSLERTVIAHGGATCPWLATSSDTLEAMGHAAVPLRSPTQLWGIMHLACPDPDCFTPHRLRLLTAIGRQMGMAIENVRLAESQRRETFRRQLLDRVLAAQEEERKRIARELHDELAQSLTVLIRDLESITGRRRADQIPVRERIHDTRAMALQILDQTRRLIFDLRPTALDDLGLLPAIRRYAQRRLELARIQLDVEIAGQLRRLDPAVETAVFRIAQEAITNVVRHARASWVLLKLSFEPGCIGLTVSDDGRGFDSAVTLEVNGGARGIGIMGMRERAELLGGSLGIDSQPGSGTTIHIEIPVGQHETDSHPVGR